MTLTVAHVEYLPTNLTGVFSWGDGTHIPLNLIPDTTPESVGPVVVPLTHIYNISGEYTGFLAVLNSVSRANLTITVSVEKI